MRARTLIALLVVVVATTGALIPASAQAFRSPSVDAVDPIQYNGSVEGTVPTEPSQLDGPDAGSGSGSGSDSSAGNAIDPVRTNLTVRLRPNGDANWTVSTELALDGPNETRAFRDLGNRYEAGRTTVGPSITPFERALAAANPGTEREMTLLDPTRSATLNGTNTTGTLSLSFVWTNFATESGDRLRVGDAFRTPRGTWLPGLAANQTLVFAPPPGYGVNSAPVGPDNGVLRWSGPIEFEPGYLTITYRRGLQITTATTTTTGDVNSGTPILPAFGGALVVVVLAVGLYVRSRGGFETGSGSEPVETDRKVNEVPSSAGENGTNGDNGGEVGFEEDLLSDEERVERLLAANGGRMRQATIVSETEWSNAKVSQLLSAMDRAGRVDKLRIGRENLISLPDRDTDDTEV